MTKSPKHDDYVILLIFWVFGRRFCDMNAQKLAISTWLISFYYQYGTSQKLYVSTKMSVMKHIFAPLLLRCKEPPMHKQHCRLSIDTMNSLSPAALTLKPLRRPSNKSSPRQHFIRLCSHIVHVVYPRTWYVCCIERQTDN